VEVLLNTPMVADLIYKGEVALIKETMAKSNEAGMVTFDQSLMRLYMNGLIDYQDAMRAADSQNDLRLAIKMESMRRGLDDPALKVEGEGQWRIQP
jgi:twitching motility protein PilU